MTMAATSPGDRPASKTTVIAAFVATTLFTTVIGGAVTYWISIESAQHQARLADRTAQVDRFIAAAQAFDPLVVKFVSEVGAGEVTEPTKGAIKANILQQSSALESARTLLSDRERELADQYVAALVAADAGSKGATGPLDSRGFAQAAVQIATLRPQLIEALRAD